MAPEDVLRGGRPRELSGGGGGGIDPNKLNHIFNNPEHNMGAVVNQFGSQQNAYQAIQQATQAAVQAQGIAGVFEIQVTVGRTVVIVRGNVIDGIARIGTAFAP